MALGDLDSDGTDVSFKLFGNLAVGLAVGDDAGPLVPFIKGG